MHDADMIPTDELLMALDRRAIAFVGGMVCMDDGGGRMIRTFGNGDLLTRLGLLALSADDVRAELARGVCDG